jgi:hypothetical protein
MSCLYVQINLQKNLIIRFLEIIFVIINQVHFKRRIYFEMSVWFNDDQTFTFKIKIAVIRRLGNFDLYLSSKYS